MASDSKPMSVTTRTVWTPAKEQQLNELMAQKERAYAEGAASIADILIASGISSQSVAMEDARMLIPVATALREALAQFDEKAQR